MPSLFPTYEEISTNYLQRIADATELMAKRYDDLLAECDRYKHQYDEEKAVAKKLHRSNAALRGVITRLKKGR